MNRLVIHSVSLLAGVAAVGTGAALRFGEGVGLMAAGALVIALTLFAASRT